MVIRQTPNNSGQYIIINNKELITILALKHNILPKYIDENNTYFVKTEELENILDTEVDRW